MKLVEKQERINITDDFCVYTDEVIETLNLGLNNVKVYMHHTDWTHKYKHYYGHENISPIIRLMRHDPYMQLHYKELL